MTVTAAPTLLVDGQSIDVADPAAPVVAIDSLSIPWGRSSILGQTTPATAALKILDRSPGATLARRTDLKGRPVLAGWSTSTGQTGTNFRGRITDIDVTPWSGGGFLVALACSSKEVDAANYTAPEGTAWPAETFSARLARIVGLLPAGLFAGGVTMPTRTDVGITDPADPTKDLGDYPAMPATVGGRTALELLRELWASLSPLPLIYDPATDGLTFVASRRHAYNPTVGAAVGGRLVPGGAGYIVAPILSTGVPLDAQLLPYAGALSQPLETSVTRVEVNYTPSGGQAATTAAGTALAAQEATIGRRTMSVQTIHSDAGNAAQLANLWASTCDVEGVLPRLSAFGYDSDRAGGFASAAAAGVLLAGRETTAELFVARSWLPSLGRRPLLGIIGGSIVYAAGKWSLQLRPAPVGFTYSTKPLPIAYASSPAAAARLVDIDPSVTLGDLAFVEVGAGYTVTTQPPWGTG